MILKSKMSFCHQRTLYMVKGLKYKHSCLGILKSPIEKSLTTFRMISEKQKKKIFQKYKLLLSIFRKQYINVKLAEHNHLDPPPFFHSLNYMGEISSRKGVSPGTDVIGPLRETSVSGFLHFFLSFFFFSFSAAASTYFILI